MKQHITAEQFRELSKENQQKLRDWANEHTIKELPYLIYGSKNHTIDENIYQVNHNIKNASLNEMNNDYAVCFTIGQCIEFLDEHGRDIKIDESGDWLISIKDLGEFREIELINALWLAVKEVLENGHKS